MTDAPEKKPGRDISDLKARLGLQRPVTPAPQAAPTPTPAPADTRRDPFAAAAPRPAPVAQQPAVITDAGPPVHVPEMKKRNIGGIIKLAVIVLAPSAFFFFYGGVYNARKLHNKTIEDAKQIKDEVTQLKRTSELIVTALTNSADRNVKAKKNALTPDPKLIDDLKDLELTPPKTDKIFRTNYAYLEGITIDRLFGYYNDTILLYAAVSRFHQTAERMESDLEQAVTRSEEAMQSNYGIIIDQRGPIPIGNLVIVGEAVCPNKAPECPPEEWEGMKVKASPTSSWTTKKIAGEDYERVVPIAPDKALAQQALIGNSATAALLSYQDQLSNVRAIAKRIVDAEKDLLRELSEEAEKKPLFVL